MIVHPSRSLFVSKTLGEFIPDERRPPGDHHLDRWGTSSVVEPADPEDGLASRRRQPLRRLLRAEVTASTVCHEANVLSTTRRGSHSSWPTPRASSSRPSRYAIRRASYALQPSRGRVESASSLTVLSFIERQSIATMVASRAFLSRASFTNSFTVAAEIRVLSASITRRHVQFRINARRASSLSWTAEETIRCSRECPGTRRSRLIPSEGGCGVMARSTLSVISTASSRSNFRRLGNVSNSRMMPSSLRSPPILPSSNNSNWGMAYAI